MIQDISMSNDAMQGPMQFNLVEVCGQPITFKNL